jgi:FkbM family methyltransferase
MISVGEGATGREPEETVSSFHGGPSPGAEPSAGSSGAALDGTASTRAADRTLGTPASQRDGAPRTPPAGLSKRIPFYLFSVPHTYSSRTWRFLHAFERPLRTLVRIGATRPPWTLTWINGTQKQARSLADVQEIGRDALFWTRTFTWTSPVTGRTVRLRGLDYPILSSGEYDWLPAQGRVVLDIGANIGDTAVYFAANGARRVVALEPYPYSCRLAEENARYSGMQDVIQIVNSGIGHPGTFRIRPDFANTVGSDLTPTEEGVEVPVLSLEQTIARFDIADAVLKMDCEGSEYDAFREASRATLRTFSHMQIEYHYGAEPLVTQLREAGFRVRVTGPRYSVVPEARSNPYMMSGYVFAERT